MVSYGTVRIHGSMKVETIKPIETIYNGYRFRSRLEARWAVAFDVMGLNYEYEHEGYEFIEDNGNKIFYLPDFHVTLEDGRKMFIEVKASMEEMTDEDRRKVYLLDAFSFDVDEKTYGCIVASKLEHAKRWIEYYGYEEYEVPNCNDNWILKNVLMVDDFTFNKAMDIAKKARFEHGEKPIKKYLQEYTRQFPADTRKAKRFVK